MKQIPELNNFYLVGGTALALHFGHRLHPLIRPIGVEDGIRLCSIPDIIAMKIAAIMKRGVKKIFEISPYYYKITP